MIPKVIQHVAVIDWQSEDSTLFRNSLKNTIKLCQRTALSRTQVDNRALPLPGAMNAILNKFESFDIALIPQIIPVNRLNRFLEFEDLLLATGLRLFGRRDLVTIRAYCLPAKSHDQISSRIGHLLNNRKARCQVKVPIIYAGLPP